MTESALVRDLAVVLVTGGIVTTLSHRLRQPVVLGYVLAGMIIGPHTPPFALVHDAHSIETLAELGVILLLFSIGLEFNVRKLRRVGAVALAGAAFEIPVMIWLGFSAGRLAGLGTTESTFLGAILSISSTTIIAKALAELDRTREEFARVVMGILIAEDLAAIVMLVVLASLAHHGEVALAQAATALGGVTLFVVTTAVVGFLVGPRLLSAVDRPGTREVLTVTTLGICFGTAILARELGFSTALGAFLAGAILAETRQAHAIEERIESVRDMFSAIFFVTVGMQIDPRMIAAHAPLVLAIAALTVAGKVFSCSLATVACGYGPRTALRVGLALGQIGELSFLIAALGREAGVVSEALYPLTVAVSAVTTLSTPYQIRGADRLADVLAPLAPLRLRTLLAFYRERLARRRKTPVSREARRSIARGFVSITIVIACCFATGRLRALAAAHGVSALVLPGDVDVLIVSAGGLVALPALAGIGRSAKRLAVEWLGPLAEGGPGRVLVEAVRLGLVIGSGALVLALATPLLPGALPLAIVAVVVGGSAIVFWRTVGDVQTRAEARLRSVLSDAGLEPEATKARDEVLALASANYPFEVAIEDFVVPFTETACNAAIRELGLRQRTGATIAAVFRDEQSMVNPDPALVLEPGDLLVLLGSTEQVARALAELAALAARPRRRSLDEGASEAH